MPGFGLRRLAARWGATSLSLLVLAAPLPAGAFAFASGWEGAPCTSAGWSLVGTGGFAAGPYDATPVVRYSGGCAYRAPGSGFVQSDHPANDVVFRARFHLFPQASNGSVVVFQARDPGGVPQFSIAHDGVSGALQVFIGSGSSGVPDTSLAGVPLFRWTSVEVAYQSGQKLAVTALGSGGTTPVTVQSNAAVAASGIDSARLGWLSTASGNPTGAMNFDAYESNNLATPIGRLCRGDADGDLDLDATDYKVLSDEILRRDIADGQPDCTEDGKIDVADRVCVAQRAGACP
jgi:hypothetical protein